MTRDGERIRQKKQHTERARVREELGEHEELKGRLRQRTCQEGQEVHQEKWARAHECGMTGRHVLGGHWWASGRGVTWSDLFIETVRLAAEWNIY